MLGRPDFEDRAVAVLGAGGSDVALHLRGPRTAGRRLFELALALLPAARDAGATLLVNDRVDVALAAGVDGVQLPGRGMRPRDARRLLGTDPLVGSSVHFAREGTDATADGADFLLVGTIHASASHPHLPAAGAELLRRIGDAVPRIAIGGVTPGRAAELRGWCEGVAVLRGVWGDAAPATAVHRYLESWTKGGTG